MDNKLSLLYRKDGTQKILSSLIAILLGMVFGSILIVIVGLTDSNIGGKGILGAALGAAAGSGSRKTN